MNKRNKTGSGVTSLQHVDNAKKDQARSLRKYATPAEGILWKTLRNRKVGGLKLCWLSDSTILENYQGTETN